MVGALPAVGIVAKGVVGAVLFPVIAPSVLGLIGFGKAGVVAGGLAAGIQSTVYGGSVATGSLFSVAQSIGAGGAIGSGLIAIAGAVAAATAAGGAAVAGAL